MTETSSKNRSFKSVGLTAPRYWSLMGIQFVLVILFLLSLGVTLWMVLQYQRELMRLMGEDFPREIVNTQSVYVKIFWVQIGVFLVGTLALFGLACHRIAGTYVALKRTIRMVREGDTSVRLKFRGSDRLDDVAESFNDMMDAIESGQFSSRPPPAADSSGDTET